MKGIRRYIALHILVKWIGLVASLVLMTVLTIFMEELYLGHAHGAEFTHTILVALGVLAVRLACHFAEAQLRFKTIAVVKKNLRGALYRKILRLGASYKDQVSTGGLLQDAVEGVDQLEVYYGTLLPEFFYGILSTITLFGYLLMIHFITAICLLLTIALLPFLLAFAKTLAKRRSQEYWEQYTRVSHLFLENLRGLSTLKIFGADRARHESMNEESATLKRYGLRMSLLRIDTITVMDLIACLGMASSAVLSVYAVAQGNLAIEGCLHVLVLSDEFFLPMRSMGEHFHKAMKGKAAEGKIRALLALPELQDGNKLFPDGGILNCEDVSFSYDGQREILRGVTMVFPKERVTAIVGASGCGKSTIAHLLMRRHSGYEGSISVGDLSIQEIDAASFHRHITYVGHKPYFFHGSVAENLRLAKHNATESEMWHVLDLVGIGDALRRRQGLETVMSEDDLHLSGGQLQRISLARAILHDSDIYIFDEATSKMDGQSEQYALDAIYALAKRKTVILISHRLPNVMKADCIYVIEKGCVAEWGTHDQLLRSQGAYGMLWAMQRVGCNGEGGASHEA